MDHLRVAALLAMSAVVAACGGDIEDAAIGTHQAALNLNNPVRFQNKETGECLTRSGSQLIATACANTASQRLELRNLICYWWHDNVCQVYANQWSFSGTDKCLRGNDDYTVSVVNCGSNYLDEARLWRLPLSSTPLSHMKMTNLSTARCIKESQAGSLLLASCGSSNPDRLDWILLQP